ncbi:DUF3108 domain-containing protein [Methylophaga sp. OBS4]|uniref:DUF3108 domain-containing protein n=1 Tax=Methylophaga sp. OBS4 TaxID=2991935 RepID=UPI002252425B|nr:DUF3108 domain-containing protein [Methylophaga sp. OBS4]MCX4188174.1 DUF3108 domain-containing protein [Methylophaga sp. OBS4]
MLRIISYILLLALPMGAFAMDIPDFSANYQVKLNGIQAGELKRTLTTEQDGLRRFTSSSQASGVFSFFKPDVIKETSLWSMVKGQVQPQQYRYQRKGGKKDKNLHVDFDWNKRIASIDDQKHPWQLKIEPETLDKLVYQISLMQDLAQGLKQFDYRIADGGRLKTYRIEVLGEELITTPMGQIKTVKLTRHREAPKDRETTLWCAPALNYLPVKLEHTEDDTVFTALIRKLKGIDVEQAFTPLQATQAIKSP